MRLIAVLCSLLALFALQHSVRLFWQAWTAPALQTAAAPDRLPEAEAAAPPAPAPVQHWPALFGTLVKEEPQPPAPPAPPPAPPAPPKPPAPPISSLGYNLKGVVRNGDSIWAIISHPTGEQILSVGDELTEGIVVDAITAGGLWVVRDGERSLLEMAE